MVELTEKQKRIKSKAYDDCVHAYRCAVADMNRSISESSQGRELHLATVAEKEADLTHRIAELQAQLTVLRASEALKKATTDRIAFEEATQRIRAYNLTAINARFSDLLLGDGSFVHEDVWTPPADVLAKIERAGADE